MPQQIVQLPIENTKTGNKKRKFRPLQGLKKIFNRQKSKEQSSSSSSPPTTTVIMDENLLIQKRLKKNSPDRITVPLSISHDSIFRNDTDSILPTSRPLDYRHQNTLSSDFSETLLVSNEYKTKLSNLLREKLNKVAGDLDAQTVTTASIVSDDEYLSLPKNLCISKTGLFNEPHDRKSDQNKIFNAYSDGSIFTTESSSTDLRSFDASRESLKLSSYHEKTCDEDSDFDSILLNHKAAHHKIAIKPKKNHAIPRKYKKNKQYFSTTNNTSDNQKVLETQNNIQQETVAEIPTVPITDKATVDKTEFIDQLKTSPKLIRSQSNESMRETKMTTKQSLGNEHDHRQPDDDNCPKSMIDLPIKVKETVKLIDRSDQEEGQVPEFMKVQLKKVENVATKCSQSKSLDFLKSIQSFENKSCDSGNAKCMFAKKLNSTGANWSLNGTGTSTATDKSTNERKNNATATAAVIRRRKSMSFDHDQPELMKVFARRSLLIDECGDDETDRRSQTFETVDNNSDKENENFNRTKQLIKDIDKIAGSAFKNIRQRKDEWEKRVQQQQQQNQPQVTKTC